VPTLQRTTPDRHRHTAVPAFGRAVDVHALVAVGDGFSPPTSATPRASPHRPRSNEHRRHS
jgi:hypothetical protein